MKHTRQKTESGVRQLTVWKKIWNAVRFFVEIFIPVCAFLVMFISFIYGIGARYLFNSPSPKSMELQTIGFVICVLTSVQVASRYEDHVTFDLLYNRMSPRIRAYCRTAGNLLISVFCAVMIPAAVRYLRQLTVGTASGNPVRSLCPDASAGSGAVSVPGLAGHPWDS